jgi:hypothetical protein
MAIFVDKNKELYVENKLNLSPAIQPWMFPAITAMLGLIAGILTSS